MFFCTMSVLYILTYPGFLQYCKELYTAGRCRHVFKKDNTEKVKEVYKSSPAHSETPVPSSFLARLRVLLSRAGVDAKLSSLYLILPLTHE